MDTCLNNINDAQRCIKTADHLLYSSFALLQDKRILIKVLIEIKNSLKHIINATLQYEYMSKQIKLYKDPKINFKTFVNKCSKKYEITNNEIQIIIQIIKFAKTQEKSPMEFIKNQKLVTFSKSMKPTIIKIEHIKYYLLITKNMLKKTKEKMKLSFTPSVG